MSESGVDDGSGSLLELVVALRESGRSILLGESGAQRVFSDVRDSAVVVGTPGCGKTTSVFVPSVLSHPGPVIATSIRHDGVHSGLRSATIEGRSLVAKAFGGQICELSIDDRHGFTGTPVWWDFTEGCADWNTALRRAKSLARAGIRATLDNYQNWRTWVAELLAPLIFNAAFCGDGSDESVYEIVSNGPDGASDWDNPNDDDAQFSPTSIEGQLEQLESLASHELIRPNHASIRMLRQFCNGGSMHEETRDSVFLLARTDVLGSYAYDQRSDVETFDLDSFLRSSGTLYITAGHGQAEDVAPVIASLIEAAEQAWVSIPPGERPHSLLLALDEVSVVAPIASMPTAIGTFGGNGVQLLLGFQHSSQADWTWGSAGKAVVGGGNHLIVFPGLDDSSVTEGLSKMASVQEFHDFEIDVSPQYSVSAGYADQARLIEERRLFESEMARSVPALRKIVERTVGQQIRVSRLGVVRNRTGNTAADVVSEVLSLTSCKPRSVRRSAFEVHEIVGGPLDTAVVKSGSQVRRLSLVPYYRNKFWMKLAQPAAVDS